MRVDGMKVAPVHALRVCCILKSECNAYDFCYVALYSAEWKFEALVHLDCQHVCSSTSVFAFNATLVTLITEAAFHIKATSLPVLVVRGREPIWQTNQQSANSFLSSVPAKVKGSTGTRFLALEFKWSVCVPARVSLPLRPYFLWGRIQTFENVFYHAFDTNWNSYVGRVIVWFMDYNEVKLCEEILIICFRTFGANSEMLRSLSKNKLL
jgi:hypothetical protein